MKLYSKPDRRVRVIDPSSSWAVKSSIDLIRFGRWGMESGFCLFHHRTGSESVQWQVVSCWHLEPSDLPKSISCITERSGMRDLFIPWYSSKKAVYKVDHGIPDGRSCWAHVSSWIFGAIHFSRSFPFNTDSSRGRQKSAAVRTLLHQGIVLGALRLFFPRQFSPCPPVHQLRGLQKNQK